HFLGVCVRGAGYLSLHLSKFRGCVYYPTHLSLTNLVKHEKREKEERVSLHNTPRKMTGSGITWTAGLCPGRGTESLLAGAPTPDCFPGKQLPSDGWAQTLAGRLFGLARRVAGPRRIAPDPCRGQPGYSQSRPRRGGSFPVASP